MTATDPEQPLGLQMNRTVVIFSFLMSLMLTPQVFADDGFSTIDVCKSFSLIAKDIMVARQKDRPMSETLPFARDRIKKWADKFGFDLEIKEAEQMAAELVMAAYDRPSFDMDGGNAPHEINSFENLHFEECYKGLTSD
jgi:hypothetical protein